MSKRKAILVDDFIDEKVVEESKSLVECLLETTDDNKYNPLPAVLHDHVAAIKTLVVSYDQNHELEILKKLGEKLQEIRRCFEYNKDGRHYMYLQEKNYSTMYKQMVSYLISIISVRLRQRARLEGKEEWKYRLSPYDF